MASNSDSAPWVAQLNDLWWIRLPAGIARISPTAAAALTDGLALSARPVVGAVVPPIVFILGLWLGRVPTGYNPAGSLHYLYSLLTIVVFVLVSQQGAALGTWLWLGFSLGDLLYYFPSIVAGTEPWLATRLLADAVLLALLVVIPLATSRLAQGIERALASAGRSGAVAGAAAIASRAVIAFVLVYLWTTSAPPLLEAVYVWSGNSPLTHGLIVSWTFLGVVVALVAGYAAATRGLLEIRAATGARERRAKLRAAIGRLRPPRFVQRLITIPLRSAFMTLFLGMMIASWSDAIRLFVLISAILFAHEFLSRLTAWTTRVARIPPFVRATVVFMIVYFGAKVLVSAVAPSNGFLLGQIAFVFGLIVAAIAVPANRVRRTT